MGSKIKNWALDGSDAANFKLTPSKDKLSAKIVFSDQYKDSSSAQNIDKTDDFKVDVQVSDSNNSVQIVSLAFKVKHKALQLSTEEPSNQLVAPLIVDEVVPILDTGIQQPEQAGLIVDILDDSAKTEGNLVFKGDEAALTSKIDSANDHDWLRLSLPKDQTVDLKFNKKIPPAVDLEAVGVTDSRFSGIFDENGNPLDLKKSTGKNVRFKTPKDGFFYVGVDSASGTSGLYEVNAKLKGAGNEIATTGKKIFKGINLPRYRRKKSKVKASNLTT